MAAAATLSACASALLSPQPQQHHDDALVASLLTRSASITPNKLWSFLRRVKLSRAIDKPENLGDGLLVAEIIHLYAPLLITSPELQRLQWEHESEPGARRAWHQLALTALAQLCIPLTEEVVRAFESADSPVVSEFFIVLFQQLDQYTRVQKSFSSYTRAAIADHYDQFTAPRTLPGATPFAAVAHRPWAAPGGKSVLRLTNVDYQTTKRDVQQFLYPLVVAESAIHIPVHLGSGKMLYQVFVVLDDAVLPLRAVDLHSGHSLRGRRVEIKVVGVDEMLAAFYGRGIAAPQAAAGEWVSEDAKLALLKLCATVKGCFNCKTPERPFEHALSVLQLVPWTQPGVVLSPAELRRLYELACGVAVALLTFLHHESFSAKLPGALLDAVAAAGAALPLSDGERQFLGTICSAQAADPHDFLNQLLAHHPALVPVPPQASAAAAPPRAASTGLYARRTLSKAAPLSIRIPTHPAPPACLTGYPTPPYSSSPSAGLGSPDYFSVYGSGPRTAPLAAPAGFAGCSALEHAFYAATPMSATFPWAAAPQPPSPDCDAYLGEIGLVDACEVLGRGLWEAL